MQQRNDKLAKENNQLKSSLSTNIFAQEEILKGSIKTEYFNTLSYREMLGAIDSSIVCIESCLECCKKVRESIIANQQILKEKNGNKSYKSNMTISGQENSEKVFSEKYFKNISGVKIACKERRKNLKKHKLN